MRRIKAGVSVEELAEVWSRAGHAGPRAGVGALSLQQRSKPPWVSWAKKVR